MNGLSPYQSEHLFLLVGMNPLPNYVAIQLLRKPNGHIYLIHTREVSGVADRLRTVTGLEPERDTTKIEVDDSNAEQIVSRVQAHVDGQYDIGLNYTGGTKHMAVHAYRAVEAYSNAHPGTHLVTSYLDARTLHMRIQELERSSFDVPVDTALQLDIETLLRLHGDTAGSYGAEPLQPEIYPVLAEIPYGALVGWRKQEISGRRGGAADARLPYGSPFEALEPFWQGCKTIGDLAECWQVDVNVLSQWLQSLWLEHYTLWAFQENRQSCQIHDSGMNLIPRGRDFEFDVFAIRGYQLYAVSCTHAKDKTPVKLKLFEAFVRARQIGGDEARVAVVCRHPEPSVVQSELEEEWDAKDRIRVFGKPDIPQLRARLKRWIQASA